MSLGAEFCSAIGTTLDSGTECLILDRTGELRSWYPIASVVFVGKSFAVGGGQNPVEPILAGKPVVFGPRMTNFATLARELTASGGAIEVRDEDSLCETVKKFLVDDQARRRLVENAQRVIDIHRGATDRTAEFVLNLTKQK